VSGRRLTRADLVAGRQYRIRDDRYGPGPLTRRTIVTLFNPMGRAGPGEVFTLLVNPKDDQGFVSIHGRGVVVLLAHEVMYAIECLREGSLPPVPRRWVVPISSLEELPGDLKQDAEGNTWTVAS
jgi:hypothetical protein